MILIASVASAGLLAGACDAPNPKASAASKGTEKMHVQPTHPASSTAKTAASFDASRFTAAPLRAEFTARFDAAPDEVWALISDHEAMPTYFAPVNKVTVDNANAETAGGVGAVRSCSVGPMALTEDIRLFEVNEALGYSVRDGNAMGLTNHFAVVLLERDGKSGTRVRWLQFFDHPKPAEITVQVAAFIDQALDGLIAKFGGERV